MRRPVDEYFPDNLVPLPLLDYAGVNRNTTAIGPAENLASARRARYTPVFDTVQVKWTLTNEEYTDFRDFVENNLGCAAAAFNIELRYPKNSDVDWWIVKFTGGQYSVVYSDDMWLVSGSLDLIDTSLVDGLSFVMVPNPDGGVDFLTLNDGSFVLIGA